MEKRLSDLVEIAENNKDCVVLKVKDDVKPIDLVRLGGFDGTETMFRVTKGSNQSTITIFRDGSRPESIEVGSTTSRLSGSMRKARHEILECVGLDFGIFTRGEWHNGHNFDEMVKMTSGSRDLDSPRKFELYRAGGSCSLFVNNMHIGHVDYKNLDEWLAERNIRLEIQDTKGFGSDRTSIGTMVRVSVPEQAGRDKVRQEIAHAEPQAEAPTFGEVIDKAYEKFLTKTGWRGIESPDAIVAEFVRFAKQDMSPSLDGLLSEAKIQAAEKNARRSEQAKTRDVKGLDR